LLLRFNSVAYSIWIPAQEIKDKTNYSSTTIIIESNPLNISRRIKIINALTQTFIENELEVLYINEINEEPYNQALMLIIYS